jgi:hypothetical protein
LHELNIDHKLYLAISDLTYDSLFQRKSVELLVEWYKLSLFVVNLASEEIIEWIN